MIFVLTYDFSPLTGAIVTNLYRSPNYGETFENINMKVGNGATIQPVVNIGPDNHRLVSTIEQSPSLVNTVYIIYGGLTTDYELFNLCIQ